MATEERLVLTAELRDNLSAPLARIDQRVQATARRISRMNQTVGDSAERGSRRAERATRRAAQRAEQDAEQATRATQRSLTRIGRAVTGMSGLFGRAGAGLRTIAGTVSGAWVRTFSNLPRSASGAWAAILNGARNTATNIKRILTNAISGAKAGMTAAAGVLGLAVGAVLAKALSTGLERAKVIQDSIASGTVLFGGDRTKAVKLIKDMAKVVTGTPYNLPDFAKAGTDMLAFGAEAEKIPGYMTAIGEASASRGRDAPEVAKGLALNVGQSLKMGKFSSDDVMSFAMSGVDALKILGNQMGKTSEEMQNMISSPEGLAAGPAIDTLMAGIMSGTNGINGETVALEGTMEALRKTFTGSFGAMQASVAKMGAGFYDPVGDASVGIMAQMPELFNALGGLYSAIGEKVFKPMGMMIADSGIITKIANLVTKVTESINQPGGSGGLLDMLGRAAPLLGIAAGGATAFGVSILRSIPLIGRFIPVLNPFLAMFIGLVAVSPALRSALMSVLMELAGVLGTLLEAVAPLLPVVADIAKFLADVAAVIIQFLSPALGPLIYLFLGLYGALKLLEIIKVITAFITGHGIAQGIASVATGGWTVATNLLAAAWARASLAMSANPIGVIIMAIAALVAGIIWAYNNVEWFKTLLDGAWNGFKAGIEHLISFWNTHVKPWLAGVGEALGKVFGGSQEINGSITYSDGGIPAMPLYGGYSGGGVVDTSAFHRASGGAVLGGYAPGVDSVPYLLSRGEAVLVPELVREIGPGNIMAANHEASGGRPAGSGPSRAAALVGGRSGGTVIEKGAVSLTFTGPANYREVKAAVRDALNEISGENERAY